MRRWVCVIALLFGFSGDGYAWTARRHWPIPIVRTIESFQPGRGTILTGAWWLRR